MDDCNPLFDSPTSGGYGCGVGVYGGQSPTCTPQTSGRICTCPTGFWVAGSESSVSGLIGRGDVFPGCVSKTGGCSSYSLTNGTCSTNGTHSTITCNNGFYAVSPSTSTITLYVSY